MKRIINGNFARSLVLIGVIAAPLIASAEDESKNELGFMGGGGRSVGRSTGCLSANLLNFSGAAEYKREVIKNQDVVVHGYYKGSKFDGWTNGATDDSYENGIHHGYKPGSGGEFNNSESGDRADLTNQAALTAYYSYNVNRYFGFSAGLSSNLFIDSTNNRVNVNYLVSPVMPSAEIRVGALDILYLAIRYQHPDMTLNYDWAGADIVIPAWKYTEFAAGINYNPQWNLDNSAGGELTAQLGIKIKPTKWLSIPLSGMYQIGAPIDHGFNVTGGLQFTF